jgi:hypothetical protein
MLLLALGAVLRLKAEDRRLIISEDGFVVFKALAAV